MKLLNKEERMEALGVVLNSGKMSFTNTLKKNIIIKIKAKNSSKEWNYKFELEPNRHTLPLDYNAKTASEVIKERMIIEVL